MPGGLSTPDSHLLSYLKGYGPCSIGELRRVFGTKKSTLTNQLDRLVTNGFCWREVNTNDRRSFLIGLTPEGLQLSEAIRGVLDSVEAEITARLDEASIEGFERVLAAIAETTRVDVRPPVSDETP